MKKSGLALLCLVTIAMIILTACGVKTFKLENISRIELSDGTTGSVVEITDIEQIQAITKPFISSGFKKGQSSSSSTGWSYRLKFFQDEKLVADIIVMSEVRISFEGYFYEIENGTIDINYLDSILNRI